jgi:hypothetical protein
MCPPALELAGHIIIYSLLQKINNSLAICLKKDYVVSNQLSPALFNRDGFFLKENSICQSGILQFATLKIIKKGECYYD